MDRLAGRVAVVTGASSGIGEAIACRLAEAGLAVVAVARREQRLQDMAARMASAGARGKVHPYVADVSKAAEVAELFAWVDATLGGVTVLVNNAAVLPLQSVMALSAAEVQDIISLNVTAVMLCCGEALNSMKRHGVKDGHLVNLNSILGHVVVNGESSTSIYAATKHAVTGFTRSLRYDVQKLADFRIRVTAVSPGRVATDMITPFLPESMQDIMLKAEDVADAVLYALACPTSVEISEVVIRCPSEEI